MSILLTRRTCRTEAGSMVTKTLTIGSWTTLCSPAGNALRWYGCPASTSPASAPGNTYRGRAASGKKKSASMSNRTTPRQPHVVVIGAGFCGLAAAYELGRHGIRATVLEPGSPWHRHRGACRRQPGETTTRYVSSQERWRVEFHTHQDGEGGSRSRQAAVFGESVLEEGVVRLSPVPGSHVQADRRSRTVRSRGRAGAPRHAGFSGDSSKPPGHGHPVRRWRPPIR